VESIQPVSSAQQVRQVEKVQPVIVAPRQVEASPAPAPKAQPDVAALIESLRNGEFNARLAAATKLGAIGSDKAAEVLKSVLRDSTAEVAREAASALAFSHSPETIGQRQLFFDISDN
jgi:HEAT repeat protein